MKLHRHHIIPRYTCKDIGCFGYGNPNRRHNCGLDDPSNIEYITSTIHADRHRVLYEKYGNDEDRLAWLGLSGIISKAQIISELASIRAKRVHTGRKRGPITIQRMIENHKGTTGITQTTDWKYKISEALIGLNTWSAGCVMSEESSKKKRERMKSKIWINNGIISRRVEEEHVPLFLKSGWVKGRRTGPVYGRPVKVAA